MVAASVRTCPIGSGWWCAPKTRTQSFRPPIESGCFRILAFVRLCYHSVNLNAWVVLLPTFAGLSCTRSPPQTLRVSIGTSIHAPASTDFFTQKGPRRRFRLTPPISSLATVCASCILLLFIFRWAGPLSQSLFNPLPVPTLAFILAQAGGKGKKNTAPTSRLALSWVLSAPVRTVPSHEHLFSVVPTAFVQL